MIREDRIALNERFIHVFRKLEEQKKIVKNDRNGKGVGDLAEKVLGNRAYGHIIRAFLRGDNKRVIDYGQAKKFCDIFNVNESYLLRGEGEPFGLSLQDVLNDTDNSPIFKGNILFTSKAAFAGSAVDVDQSEEHEYFSIPGLTGNGLVAFPIDGNSMEPVILDGDIVICRELINLNEIRDNEIYAIKTDGSLWVKYVKKIKDGQGRVIKLNLISANNLEHDPFEVEVSQFTRLYKVRSRINQIQR
jgi:hypothetical protein